MHEMHARFPIVEVYFCFLIVFHEDLKITSPKAISGFTVSGVSIDKHYVALKQSASSNISYMLPSNSPCNASNFLCGSENLRRLALDGKL